MGVASPEQDNTTEEAQKRYHGWLTEGWHGSMSWMKRHEPLKYDPQALDPTVQAVLIVALPYAQDFPATQPLQKEGRIARYAWGRDYHKVFLKKLQAVARSLSQQFPEEHFRAFTDTSPLDERFWAEKAGLSFTGRNRLAITDRWGSWFFLGEILSSRYFAPTHRPQVAHHQCPSSCRRCWHVCPTRALSDKGLDARLCIAYLTIEFKGSIPPDLRPLIGDKVFGCDLCQEVCPFNLQVPQTTEKEFLNWKAGPWLDLASILRISTEEDFTRQWGGSPLHRAGFSGLRRNACLVAGNLNRNDLLPLLKALTVDPDPIVAEAAEWAVDLLECPNE